MCRRVLPSLAPSCSRQDPAQNCMTTLGKVASSLPDTSGYKESPQDIQIHIHCRTLSKRLHGDIRDPRRPHRQPPLPTHTLDRMLGRKGLTHLLRLYDLGQVPESDSSSQPVPGCSQPPHCGCKRGRALSKTGAGEAKRCRAGHCPSACRAQPDAAGRAEARPVPAARELIRDPNI